MLLEIDELEFIQVLQTVHRLYMQELATEMMNEQEPVVHIWISGDDLNILKEVFYDAQRQVAAEDDDFAGTRYLRFAARIFGQEQGGRNPVVENCPVSNVI
jgi:hypothetical protein